MRPPSFTSRSTTSRSRHVNTLPASSPQRFARKRRLLRKTMSPRAGEMRTCCTAQMVSSCLRLLASCTSGSRPLVVLSKGSIRNMETLFCLQHEKSLTSRSVHINRTVPFSCSDMSKLDLDCTQGVLTRNEPKLSTRSAKIFLTIKLLYSDIHLVREGRCFSRFHISLPINPPPSKGNSCEPVL